MTATATAGPKLWAALLGIDYPQLTGNEPCRQNDIDPEVFFPDGHDDAAERTATAKRLCDGCPLATRHQCLSWALANPAEAGDGIWAGLTAAERRAALRRFKKATARTTTSTQQDHPKPEDQA